MEHHVSAAAYSTYRVDLQIPVLSGLLEVDEDFFIWKAEFFERDMCSVSPWTAMVRVQGYLRGETICSCRHYEVQVVVIECTVA